LTQAPVQRRVAFLGRPGVGKGTYASFLAPALGLRHVVVGDLVRNEIDSRTALGDKMSHHVKQGQLIPDNIIMELVASRLSELNGFILDGMPRSLEQALALDKLLSLDLVVQLELSEEVMLQKALARRIGPDNTVYNLAYIRRDNWDMPPMLPGKIHKDSDGRLFCEHGMEIKPNQIFDCRSCTDGLRTRADDTLEVLRERLRSYDTVSRPVVDHYISKGICLSFQIEGDVQACWPKLLKVLQEKCKANKEEPAASTSDLHGAQLICSRL
jgi:adenylate kinase